MITKRDITLNKSIFPDILPVMDNPIFERNVTYFNNDFPDYKTHIPLMVWLFAEGVEEVNNVFAYRIQHNNFLKFEIYKSLPFASISSVLKYDFETKDNIPIYYTGLMDFDIKQEDNPDFDLCDIANELAKLPQIAYLGLDTNGSDYFGIIPISNPNRYADHFKALKSILSGKYDIHISGSDNVLHTRKISIDFDPYINENAHIFRI